MYTACIVFVHVLIIVHTRTYEQYCWWMRAPMWVNGWHSMYITTEYSD